MPPEREKRRRRRRSPVEIISATTRSGASRSVWDNLVEEEFSFFSFFLRGGEEAGAYDFRWKEKRRSVSQSVLMKLKKLGKACGHGGRREEERSRLC